MLKWTVAIGLFVLALFALFHQRPAEPLSESDRYMGKCLHDHFEWAEKEYGIRCFGIGGNTPSGIEHAVYASMRGDMKVSEEEARQIFLRCVYDLLSRINATRELRPYLIQYPFAPENIEYSIHFDDLKKGTVLPPFISHMHTFRGVILYFIWDMKANERLEILRESYPEADEKVREYTHAK